jgi:hypothetical protein
MVIRWFSTSFDMAKSGEQEKAYGDPPLKKKNGETSWGISCIIYRENEGLGVSALAQVRR